jgi:hypothetical protein
MTKRQQEIAEVEKDLWGAAIQAADRYVCLKVNDARCRAVEEDAVHASRRC